jgi:dCMP deaminase
MDKAKWDSRYMELAKYVSQWSKDPSTKVGAVLVNYELHREFVGFNGFARGVEDSEERLNDRETKYQFVVHAEVNAILKAGAAARGASLYVWPSFAIPNICNECAKVAVQAGIRELIGYMPDPNNPRAARWGQSISIAKMMFDEAGISYRTIEEPQ